MEKKPGNKEPLKESTLFMCVKKQELLDLCELFPSTAENIKRRALERRMRFMQQKKTNSKAFEDMKNDMLKDYNPEDL